jgi:hypothetical protein
VRVRASSDAAARAQALDGRRGQSLGEIFTITRLRLDTLLTDQVA